MDILKFRIKNYKSIQDSGDCYLTDSITILAGKNESGKTSVLEALEDFDTDREIREEAKPIHRPGAVPVISITFGVKKEVLNGILGRVGVNEKKSSKHEIEVIKQYPGDYSLSVESQEALGFQDKSRLDESLTGLKEKWTAINGIRDTVPQLGGTMFEFDLSDYDVLSAAIATFKTQTAPNVNHITDEGKRVEFTTSLDDMIAKITEIKAYEKPIVEFLDILKKEFIPYFILFNTFEDVFPNKIPFAELTANEWISDLSEISDLDVSTITASDDRKKYKHKRDVNLTLNSDYERYWTQDASSLSVEWDSSNLSFWIEEDGDLYEPSLRSKGRQWHLGFYIKISARAREDVPNIILIDEPGLFLHAKAQKDILRKLEDSGKETQIVFSTHSPYLLEPEQLGRIRLVHRCKKDGTIIENKVHALADKETLTPILTAIGLELSAGISHIDKVKNVIVEGPSDLFYLQAFKVLSDGNNINFVFGGGAGNMPFVGTILNGWGCEVVYLFDNDQGKTDGEKNLKRNWMVSSDLILSVLNTKGSIEDIFTSDDFCKYVLNDESKKIAQANSTYIKKQKCDKVLLAKLFKESVQNGKKITLSQETMNNIRVLSEKIKSSFK